MRRTLMGGFMPPPPDPVIVRDDEGVADTLRHLEILGRLIFRHIGKLEKQMADQNVTIDDILAATKEQQGAVGSMGALLQKIHDRVNQLLAGQISPQLQASLNEAFAEVKGNTRALTEAVTTYTPDAGASTEPGNPALSATSTTLSTSKAVVNSGEEFTLSAGVSSSDGNPNAITGKVTFATEAGDIGVASLDSTGVAALSTTGPAGDHSLTATYGGDANYASSTSTAITQSVLPPAPPAPPADTTTTTEPPAAPQSTGDAAAPAT
jgi:uncharacterized coiled-coil protein SlyX